MYTSERSDQQDAKNLYENHRKLVKHFAMSPKNTELLNNALYAMEMNDIHLLNWGLQGWLAFYMLLCTHQKSLYYSWTL